MMGSPPISGRKVDNMKFAVSGRGKDKAILVELNERDVKRGITPNDLYRLFMPVNVDVYKYEWGVKIPVRFVGQVELVKKIYSIAKKFGFLESTISDIECAQKNCRFYLSELRELGYDCSEIEKRILGFKYDRVYAVLCYHSKQVRVLISRLIEVTRKEKSQEFMSELYKYATRYCAIAEGTSEPWAYERHTNEADVVISALEHAKTESGFNALDFASSMEYQSTDLECILAELKSDVQIWKNRVSLAEDYLSSETPKDEENVSHETCYADTDSAHTTENVKLGAKWGRIVIEYTALNFGFSPEVLRKFVQLFVAVFESETGWDYDPDTAEAILYGSGVKHIDFFTNDEMGNALWDKCFDSAAEQLENMLSERDEQSQPTPEAEEVAERIRGNAGWDLNDCEELCRMAGMSGEWELADGSEFESVVYAAAEKLGVEI